jgi:hypothetical protein
MGTIKVAEVASCERMDMCKLVGAVGVMADLIADEGYCH